MRTPSTPRSALAVESTSPFVWIVNALDPAEYPNGPPELATESLTEAWSVVAAAARISLDQLAKRLAERYECYGAASTLEQAKDVSGLTTPEYARRHLALPIRVEGDYLLVAMANAVDVQTAKELEFISSRRTRIVVTPPSVIAVAIDRGPTTARDAGEKFSNGAATAEAKSAAAFTGEWQAAGPPTPLSPRRSRSVLLADLSGLETNLEAAASDSRGQLRDESVVALVDSIFANAVEQRASDIHIQALPTSGLVRFRVDGVLRTGTFLGQEVLDRVIGRIKAVSGMDPADRGRPQDGRGQLQFGHERIKVRISTVPSFGSETCVVRLLHGRGVEHGLEGAGFLKEDIDTLRDLTGRATGVLALTGPTGSGKTSTLYAALSELNTNDVDIHTVEDPVEYPVPGLVQIEVHHKRGVTFASLLRAILRQDPDIILVGEIRDKETAEMAAQAAMTGHLVLTTLHTNDAPTSIPRMRDLGVESTVLADTMIGVVAQRLVRSLCECAVPVTAPLTASEERLRELTGQAPLRRAKGCERCGQTGYHGRMPIVEIMRVTPEIQDLIMRDAPLSQIRPMAMKQGMRGLAESGLQRIQRGETDANEVRRAVGSGFWLALAEMKDRSP